jgi:NAD(P)-dependent dehydrogenase (short-subunit alcohol dehydrogenase family)
MAEWFSDRGAMLGLCARRVPDISGDRIVRSSVDVTDEGALRRFASDVSARLGPIDLWMNNAAVLDPVIAQRDLVYEMLEAHLRVNLGGVLNGTRAYLAQLELDDHTGALVNMSSGLAKRGMAGVGAYAAAKAGVDRLTETIALEEVDRLPVVLSVSPGVVETSMQSSLRSQDASVLHEVEMFKRLDSENRMNSPAWVAENIAGWVFGDVDPGGVLVRVPEQPKP